MRVADSRTPAVSGFMVALVAVVVFVIVGIAARMVMPSGEGPASELERPLPSVSTVPVG